MSNVGMGCIAIFKTSEHSHDRTAGRSDVCVRVKEYLTWHYIHFRIKKVGLSMSNVFCSFSSTRYDSDVYMNCIYQSEMCINDMTSLGKCVIIWPCLGGDGLPCCCF